MFKLCLLVLAAFTLAAGKPNNPRIIGGSPAEQGQFPFLASLQQPLTRFHFCGAGIINEYYLVSAGHCLYGARASQVTVYVGSVYLSQGGTYYPAAALAVHPGFNPDTLYDDVSIIRVKNAIQFNSNVQPLNLPININVNTGDSATATGWGDISYPNEQTPNQLQYLTSQIVDNQACSRALNADIRAGQICFGGNDGHGLCFGDSGSPLVYESNGQYYTIGAVSWGNPCGIGSPDVYTRISYYVDWIQEQQKLLEGHA